jgi:A/G-specific adenine glycosylase
MNSLSAFSIIAKRLSQWYETHKRDLPWRHKTSPYHIWISEIILQQTRVEQGLPYYEAITTRFPDVKTLAEAPLNDLLKLWQGLGYYSRARNMHTAARQVLSDFGGTFPSNYTDLLKLKGVGEYTAAAIASIAYNEPKAVVDGNVYRVLSRLFGIDTPINSGKGKKLFASLAEELLDHQQPSRHNQAMMDFGAIQCTPAAPDCTHCPLQDRCEAFATQNVGSLPVKTAGAPKQSRYFQYFVLTDGQNTWLQQRLNKDIWQNLWEFPLLETETDLTMEQLLEIPEASRWIGTSFEWGSSVLLKHVLSHRIIYARFIPIHIHALSTMPNHWHKVPLETVHSYPVSKLTEIFLEKHHLI